MRKLEWSPDALEDLDVIWSYIAEDNVERASSFVAGGARKSAPALQCLRSL